MKAVHRHCIHLMYNQTVNYWSHDGETSNCFLRCMNLEQLEMSSAMINRSLRCNILKCKRTIQFSTSDITDKIENTTYIHCHYRHQTI
ncbi:hypothetical protein EUGRSUZ_B00435 [Eucalyptus grandis]|uniref:Uncharacterized protein n=2 Tax=Eucalyptus grandis TaxID=71139 RepID=A0ACC3LMV9_EUCGR|nr:hypothetical protein EUGRSUZ_B00435 [Eucalyptus grandis]